MSTIARRIVSGQKARFKDSQLELELDLSYVTDNVIIMGFPASGFESLYRNKRAEVRKFLDHRHHSLYRIYNFCPLTENQYDSSYFHDRVSRYPFPDHQVPPLSMIPLFVADMTEWLETDPDAIAVIHCKAGKGRSGTMTCCYLISLPYLSNPPQNIRNYSQMKRPESPPPLTTVAESSQEYPKSVSTRSTETIATSLSQATRAHSLHQQPRPQPQRHHANSLAFQPIADGKYWQHSRTSLDHQVKVDPSFKPMIQPRCSSLQLDCRPTDNHDWFGTTTSQEAQQLADRLKLVFDLHTKQRMQTPSPKKAMRNRSKSSAALKPSVTTQSTPTKSNNSLLALGTSPSGRSCDALHILPSSPLNSSRNLFADSSRSHVTLNLLANPSSFSIGAIGPSLPTNPNPQDNAEPQLPRMGVSIPSQRRWVGYWARILAGKDARKGMKLAAPTPKRQIRITRITVDRQIHAPTKSTQRSTEKVIPHSDWLCVQLGRYDDSLVERLESWERGARLRARAFGQNDPSGLAGDLDEDEQKQKRYLKELLRRGQNLRCWNGERFEKKHEGQIGNWGINVMAEAERGRAFNWKDEQPQLDYFSLISEGTERLQLDEFGNPIMQSKPSSNGVTMSTTSSEQSRERQKSAGPQLWRYGFLPKGQDSKGRNGSTSSGDSGYYSSTFTDSKDLPKRCHSQESSGSQNSQQNNNADTGLGRKKSFHGLRRTLSGVFQKGGTPSPLTSASNGSYNATTTNATTIRATSTEYLAPPGTTTGREQLLDADREICIRVLVGKTNTKHAKLPDLTAAGWVWIIPSFEDPFTGDGGKARAGARTVVRFEKDQIDFGKQSLGIAGIEVEWEWIIGDDNHGEEEVEEDEEEVSVIEGLSQSGSLVFKQHAGRSALYNSIGNQAWQPSHCQNQVDDEYKEELFTPDIEASFSNIFDFGTSRDEIPA